MIKNIYDSNYIVIIVHNYKKVLESTDKKKHKLNISALNYITINNYNFILIKFDINNYFHEKENFINFINHESLYFDLVCVTYNKKMYSLSFFELELLNYLNLNVLNELNLFIYINFLKKNINLKIFLFLAINLFNRCHNLFKCLLFINQHRN